MKLRYLLIILLFVSAIGIASAEDFILSPSKTTYNLGEQLSVVGDIDLGTGNYTILRLYVQERFSNSSNETKSKITDFNVQGRKKINLVQLNKGVPIPVNLADREPGLYYIYGILEDSNGQPAKELVSPDFELTNVLKLTWSVNSDAFTLGQEIRVSGAALLNDNSLTGGITIQLFNKSYTFNTGAFQIVEKLTQSYDDLEIYIEDAYGNFIHGNNSFEVYTSLETDFSNSLTTGSSEEPFYIMSPVTYFDGTEATFDADLSVDGNTYKVSGTGRLEYKLEPPADMTPGMHELYITISDKNGNTAKKTLTLNLIRDIGTITVSTDKNKYKAGEKIQFTVEVRDQQGKPFPSGVTIKLNSPSGETISARTANIDTSGKVTGEFDIPAESEGTWSVVAECRSKTDSKEIDVRKGWISGASVAGLKRAFKIFGIIFLIVLALVTWLTLENRGFIKSKPLTRSLKWIGVKIEKAIGKELRWIASKIGLNKLAAKLRSSKEKKHYHPYIVHHPGKKMKYSDLWKKPEKKGVPKKVKSSELFKDKKDDHHMRL